MVDSDLQAMERCSLEYLAARFALERVVSANSANPRRALLLELILASNGAELTVRFLKQLCELCQQFDEPDVID